MEQSFALKRTKDVLWIIAIAGLVAMIGRTFFGLGASTNLTDGVPWGLWKVMNMVAGVCLATGGFLVACAVYVFRIEKYRPLVRPAVLIAFLGYGASGFALMFDIGLPHRIWHPLIPTMWNYHSFLFEVTICVMTYFAVATLEFLPILFERFPWRKITHFLHEIALPFVVLGITLSTLHHSSLGSLFMVSPTRLHPLWFSTWIPIEFLVSSIGAGMASIVLITIIYSKLYGKQLNMPLLTGMARASGVTLVIYFLIRAVDFTLHGKWTYVFVNRTPESYIFMIEIMIAVFIPAVIFLAPRLRNNLKWLVIGTASAVAGVVMYRLDAGIVGYFRDAGAIYLPSLSELFFSFGVFAAAALVFLFVVEHYYIYEPPPACAAPEAEGAHPDEAPQWTWAEFISIFNNPNALRISLIIVAVIPLSILAFKDTAIRPFQFLKAPVSAALGDDPMRHNLRIDGNRNGQFVIFPHEAHKDARLIGEGSCATCHHLDLPGDHSTACFHCHRDMKLATDIFNHDLHQQKLGDKDSCVQCHNLNLPKGGKNAKSCYECHHEDMNGMTAEFNHLAPGYEDAMHGKCLTCHRLVGDLEKNCASQRDCPSNCAFCH